MRFAVPRTVIAVSCFTLALTGCTSHSVQQPIAGVALHGSIHGGQQPISGATLQLYAAGTSGVASAAIPLLTTRVTTSDGTGSSDSNANSGNANNSLAVGFFTLTGDYTCPSPDTQVYLVATGGNPGLTAGTNNTAIAEMAALGSCGKLSSSTSISVNEVTTVGSVAALYPFMTSYSALGSASTATAQLANAFGQVSVYVNTATGSAPGPNLPAGYYASSTEINTLADVLAACINSSGGTDNDGTLCGTLFHTTKPASGPAATDTIGAILNVLGNPASNVAQIFALASGTVPFQPTLASAPSDWTLPIVQTPVTPFFTPGSGNYAFAQQVTITAPTNGTTVHYTTDGSTPTAASPVYSGPITVSAATTLQAIAVGNRVTSPANSASYTLTGAPAAPAFSLPAGSYSGPQVLSLSSATADAAIFYTLDGSTPTAASLRYTQPIQISTNGTVSAIAIANNVSSAVSSAVYSLLTSGGYIYNYAGGGLNEGDGLPATQAVFNNVAALAFAPNGDLYISEAAGARVRRISAATGIISTVAGNGTTGYSGDGGPAAAAELSDPSGLAVDGAGNLYISDTGNSRVRMVAAATGIISTVAGNGVAGSTGDGGPATAASLSAPNSIAFDTAGNLFVSDPGNETVREVLASTGNIVRFAGNGTAGFSGDGGPATAAELNGPQGLTLDLHGNLFIADLTNLRVREVFADTGNITTVAGSGSSAYNGDGEAATTANLGAPSRVAIDSVGNLYIADYGQERVHKVSALTGTISTVAGSGSSASDAGDGGPATSAGLNTVIGIALDSNGNLFLGEAYAVREVSATTGLISTLGGSSYSNLQHSTGPAITNHLQHALAVALDAAGDLYLTDNNILKRVDVRTGALSIAAGTGVTGTNVDNVAPLSATLGNLGAIAIDASGNIYLADFQQQKIHLLSASTGLISTVAGTGTAGYNGDNQPATSAQINITTGGSIAVDGAGNLYIADNKNFRVRMVSASTGVITTVAGTGVTTTASSISGPATSVALIPQSLAVDTAGNLFIGGGGLLLRLDAASQNITTLAGNGSGAFVDGPASSASFKMMAALAVDSVHNVVYVADTLNYRIRKVDLNAATVSTYAGTGATTRSGDGGPATAAGLAFCYGLALAPDGRLFLTDYTNARIRVIVP